MRALVGLVLPAAAARQELMAELLATPVTLLHKLASAAAAARGQQVAAVLRAVLAALLLWAAAAAAAAAQKVLPRSIKMEALVGSRAWPNLTVPRAEQLAAS